MCCQRFDTNVLLTNIYGSPEYKNDMEIPIQEFVKDYCRYLDNILPGCNLYETSETDIKNFVTRHQQVFQWKNGKLAIKPEEGSKFKRDTVNEPYPEVVEEKLKFAADVCLMIFAKNQIRARADG